ncbi:hypothetical protein CKAH01_02541 [Colletotrichum kahawae]|uniref:Uncharacterized protein n=1 Tax=Colletotrichum kahawae TaxID=34407 RepID=A0AAD9XYD1_COLKA|nr:hypothetical protein CKAH01_02541 [Colletotrichum kahawae]
MEYGSALRIGELPPFQPNKTRTNIPRQTDHAPRNLQHKSVRCCCSSKTSSFGLVLPPPCSNHQLFPPLLLSCRLTAGKISRGTPCFTCPFSSSSDHASQYPPKPPSSSPPPLPSYAVSTSHCENGPRKPDDDGTLHGRTRDTGRCWRANAGVSPISYLLLHYSFRPLFHRLLRPLHSAPWRPFLMTPPQSMHFRYTPRNRNSSELFGPALHRCPRRGRQAPGTSVGYDCRRPKSHSLDLLHPLR